MSDSRFNVDTREHLVYLLSEAAEVEHNLMCCYLYAAFSLKTGDGDGLTEEEMAAVRRWDRTIVGVAVEEMAHLALVANLTSAIGAAPHFGRPNFPVASGYHPSGMVVKLAPFSAATLDHFVYLERPDGMQLPAGEGFEPPLAYERQAPTGRLMPSAQDYATVGQLYDGIREGLRALVARHGEAGTFVGDPGRQLGPEMASLPGLRRIGNLDDALAAIDTIVIQGEGSPGDAVDSHFRRFASIRDEWQALAARNPAFEPALPAADNPVMRKPPLAEGRVWVRSAAAAPLMDLANAAYNQMLRMLVQAYAETRGPAAQSAWVDAAIDLMFGLAPWARELARLPAADDAPRPHAGVSFATLRGFAPLADGAPADAFLLERQRELAAKASEVLGLSPGTDGLQAGVQRLQQALGQAVAGGAAAQRGDASGSAVPSASSPPSTVPMPTIVDGVESARGSRLTIHFEGKRCIHARHCVLGLPDVFKANVKGPWIDPDAATTEALVVVAHACPSGAIQYSRHDGGPDETAPPVNVLRIRENGPIALHADLRLAGRATGMRATLCRCGASKNKPFCDGSHHDIDFVATGEPATRPSEPLARRGGPLTVRPQVNGPLLVDGPLEICAGTGRTVDRVTRAALCRCGGSANKPFCDGTHQRNGFTAPA